MSSLRQAARVTRVATRLAGKRWRLTRSAYLQQHPFCECGRDDCRREASCVAHRRAPGNDPALFYDWNNLQALSRDCYRRTIEDSR